MTGQRIGMKGLKGRGGLGKDSFWAMGRTAVEPTLRDGLGL